MYSRSGLLKGTGLHLSEDITRKHKDKVNVPFHKKEPCSKNI